MINDHTIFAAQIDLCNKIRNRATEIIFAICGSCKLAPDLRFAAVNTNHYGTLGEDQSAERKVDR